jgi:hypothetical protein
MKLSGRNVKGCTFEHDLAPVTLFHGDNWAGKTARLDALTLALAGYLPGVANKPNEVFDRVASGNPLNVRAQADDGLVLDRTWSRNGKGSVSLLETTACAGFEMPAVALDPSEFLGLSARERVKFLFSRCKLPPDLTPDAAAKALVANVKNIRLEENSPASELAIADVASVLGGTTLTKDAGRTTQTWVEGLVELVSERKKAATANVQRLEKTMQGLTQTAAVGPTPPSDAEARLTKARADLETASAALHAVEADLRQRQEELRSAEAAAKTTPDIGALRAEVEAAEKALADHKVPGQPNPVTSERLQRSERDVATTASRVRVAKDTLRGLEEELSELQKEATCPKCGQSLAKLRPKMVKAQKDMIKEGEHALAEAKAEHEAAENERKAADVEWNEWANKHEAWVQADMQHRALERILDNAKAELAQSGAATAAFQDALAKLPVLKAKGDALAKEVEALRAKEVEARAKVSEADVQYKRLVAARSEAATRARTEAELAKGLAEEAVWKQVQKLVAELQAKLVEAAVGPLIDTANKLCGGLLRAPLALIDGELSFDLPGTGWNHRTFSGSEKLISYCALSAALSEGAPIRIVMMDELSRLDDGHRKQLIGTLCKMQEEGTIDQAVIIDTRPVGFSAENFCEIKVDG